MIILTENDTDAKEKTATIGFFDGTHTGHKYLLDTLQREADRYGNMSMVITFRNHPRLFFDPDCKLKYLTLPDEKISNFDREGVDFCLMLEFSRHTASMTSRQFMQLLHDRYGVRYLLIGYDHRFGSDTNATFSDYKRYGSQIGIEIIRCDEHTEKQRHVSSSEIRKALGNGNIAEANTLLGYNYSISGIVVDGHKLGRTIGFPTANIKTDDKKLIPAKGVYSVKITVHDKVYSGMLNIGNRPTVSGSENTIEVNIFDFDSDIYNEEVGIEFLQFIRTEQKFSSLEELKRQLLCDKDKIMKSHIKQ